MGWLSDNPKVKTAWSQVKEEWISWLKSWRMQLECAALVTLMLLLFIVCPG